MEFIDISAKTVEEAIAKGLAQLTEEGRELVETKVMEEPSGGFLGIGKKPARVRLFYQAAATAEKSEESEKAKSSSLAETESAPEKSASAEDQVAETADSAESEEAAQAGKEPKEAAVQADTKPELTAEEQAAIADAGKQFLQDMFAKMGLQVVIEKMSAKDKITFQIHGDNVGILIGKHGQTLDAIQYLTNLVANKERAVRCRIVVDVENYRVRREDTLTQLAKRLGSKVKRERQKVVLEPMNAFERKIIHLALQDEPNIVTDSEGEEPYRHVVISYKRK